MKLLRLLAPLVCGALAAQGPLPVPISSVPLSGTEVAVVLSDQTVQVWSTADGNLQLRSVISAQPTVLHATWKDSTGVTHEVDTDCKGMSVQECWRIHTQAVKAGLALFPM